MKCMQLDLPVHIVLNLLDICVYELRIYECLLFLINSRISTRVLNVH